MLICKSCGKKIDELEIKTSDAARIPDGYVANFTASCPHCGSSTKEKLFTVTPGSEVNQHLIGIWKEDNKAEDLIPDGLKLKRKSNLYEEIVSLVSETILDANKKGHSWCLIFHTIIESVYSKDSEHISTAGERKVVTCVEKLLQDKGYNIARYSYNDGGSALKISWHDVVLEGRET